jgi:peroxiredoxin
MIKVGDRLPEGSFRVKQEDGSMRQVPVDELFSGQKVVLVGVPGAFTSTCHAAHIPQFVTHANEIKGHGVDRIVVLAVNDHHVMKSWSQSLDGKERLEFVSDGNAEYARALGLDIDLSANGMGTRLKRFSALVEDGVVKALNFEPEGSKGIQETGVATILRQLA